MLRADKVHGLDALRAQIAFQVEIEVGRIDTNEDVRPLCQQAGLQLPADAHDSR
jgi:hypothetical protein